MDIVKIGTKDAIKSLRCLAERSIEFNQDLQVCFVVYKKAFDRVKCFRLIEVLQALERTEEAKA